MDAEPTTNIDLSHLTKKERRRLEKKARKGKPYTIAFGFTAEDKAEADEQSREEMRNL